MGTRSSSETGMIRPYATTTANSTPASATSSMEWETARPSSSAAAFTGLGVTALPRPRRRSGLVTHSTTSCPASTRACRGGTAISGVPRKASRATPVTVEQAGGPGGSSAGEEAREAVGVAGGQMQRAATQDLHGLLTLIGVEPLDQQDAVEVVELVLEDPPLQLRRLDGDLVPV